MILCNAEKITEVYYRSAETNNGKLLSSVLASAIKSIDHPVCKLLVGTYDRRYFGIGKNGLRLRLSCVPAL